MWPPPLLTSPLQALTLEPTLLHPRSQDFFFFRTFEDFTGVGQALQTVLYVLFQPKPIPLLDLTSFRSHLFRTLLGP